jgi:hypothetical protein
MTIRITTWLDAERHRHTVSVAGPLRGEDVTLVERQCRDVLAAHRGELAVDLADVTYLDAESAATLRRLRRELGASLVGMPLLARYLIEEHAEADGRRDRKEWDYEQDDCNGVR